MLIHGPIIHCDQAGLILEALQTEHDFEVVVVNTRSNFVYLDELESLLSTQDSLIKK